MPRLDYKVCKNCGRHSSEAGLLTRTRLCDECWQEKLRIHNEELHEHRGPAFQAWRRSIAASVGAVVLDDLPRQT